MKASKGKFRQIKKSILILCEDSKSSKKYFDDFKRDEEFKRNLGAVRIEIYQPRDFSPLGLYEEAEKKLRDRTIIPRYDEVWCVFDRDQHANLELVFNKKNKKIKLAFSNVCFEVWVLLHFDYTSKHFENSDKIIKYITDNHLSNYNKSDSPFDDLRDKINAAMKNAEKLMAHNSRDLLTKKPYELNIYTDIHILVEKMIKGFE